MQDLIEQVVQRGRDRGLDKVGHLAQAKYTLKETAELLDAYADGNQDAMNDAIGDILVTLIVGASNTPSVLRQLSRYLVIEEFETWVDNDESFMCHYNDLIDSVQSMYDDISNHDSPHYSTVIDSLYTITVHFNGFASLKDCLQLAYNEIKNRKGKLVNGQFIKECDK